MTKCNFDLQDLSLLILVVTLIWESILVSAWGIYNVLIIVNPQRGEGGKDRNTLRDKTGQKCKPSESLQEMMSQMERFEENMYQALNAMSLLSSTDWYPKIWKLSNPTG